MKRTLIALIVVCLWPAHARADDTAEPDTSDEDDTESLATTPRISGDTIEGTASELAEEYRRDQVKYTPGSADCSSFVAEVMNRCGIDVPRTTTHDISADPNWESIPSDDAAAGDVILNNGHMGIYSGDQDDGTPMGWQMGKHGAAEIKWGDSSSYFRPLQTSDYEEQIGQQVQELWQDTPTGAENDVQPSAVSDADSSVEADDAPTESISVSSDTPRATYTRPAPIPYLPPPSRPTYTPPKREYSAPRSTCTGRVCARAAW